MDSSTMDLIWIYCLTWGDFFWLLLHPMTYMYIETSPLPVKGCKVFRLVLGPCSFEQGVTLYHSTRTVSMCMACKHYTYRGTSPFPVRVCKNLGHYTVLMTTEKELRDLYHVITCYGTGLLGFAWFQTQFICLLWQARVLIPMMMMRTWKQLGWKF